MGANYIFVVTDSIETPFKKYFCNPLSNDSVMEMVSNIPERDIRYVKDNSELSILEKQTLVEECFSEYAFTDGAYLCFDSYSKDFVLGHAYDAFKTYAEKITREGFFDGEYNYLKRYYSDSPIIIFIDEYGGYRVELLDDFLRNYAEEGEKYYVADVFLWN